MSTIQLKSEKEIQIMRKGGKILKSVLTRVLDAAKPGVSLLELDSMAESLIKKDGGTSSFKRVPGYKWTCCFAINDGVVHGIPTKYKLQPGDVVGIDCGVYLEGFHTDSAWSILLPGGHNIPQKKKFLQVGEEALKNSIEAVKVGNHIGHISQAMQMTIEKNGYSIVESLTGHGVGRDLHEKPEIPGFLKGKIEKTPKIVPGMVLAIEAIYNMGSPQIIYSTNDGWTIATQDGTISGLFEKTVAVENDGVFVLT